MAMRYSSRAAPREASWRLWAVRVLFLLLLLGAVPLVARAAVDLIAFEAFPDGDVIRVTWETASEVDMAGFFVQRAALEAGPYVRISDVIPADGGMTGRTYEYVDEDVARGDTFYYQLEALEVTGFIERFGPISATLPLPPTATPTPTPTPSLTPPFDPGGSSPSPTNTPMPGTATATPTTRPTRTPGPATVMPTLTQQTATATSVFSLRSPTPDPTRSPSATAAAPATGVTSSPVTPSPTPALTPLVIPTEVPSETPAESPRLAEAEEPHPSTLPTGPAVKEDDSGLSSSLLLPVIGVVLLGLLVAVGFLWWRFRRRV
jgi:hypothetical protein